MANEFKTTTFARLKYVRFDHHQLTRFRQLFAGPFRVWLFVKDEELLNVLCHLTFRATRFMVPYKLSMLIVIKHNSLRIATNSKALLLNIAIIATK